MPKTISQALQARGKYVAMEITRKTPEITLQPSWMRRLLIRTKRARLGYYLWIATISIMLLIPRLQIDWACMDSTDLNAYRQLHRLRVAPAFGSDFNCHILSRPGISRRSPSMLRRQQRRKTSKEQLAFVVKKDFNDAMTNEPESITNFIYSVRTRGMASSSFSRSPWLILPG